MTCLMFCWVLLCCLLGTSTTFANDNKAQVAQANVNLQSANNNNNNNNVDPNNPEGKPSSDVEAGSSSVAVQQQQQQQQQQQHQQDVIVAGQDNAQQPPAPQQQPQPNALAPSQQQPPQPLVDAQNVQLLKEANAQYQYQINSRYEEKTRPVYANDAGNGSPYVLVGQTYPYGPLPGYPYYRENNQYQELGNGQRRTETNVALNDAVGVKSQYENQDQSTYTQQRSQSYSEFGRGESSPDYNTYAYKRTYY